VVNPACSKTERCQKTKRDDQRPWRIVNQKVPGTTPARWAPKSLPSVPRSQARTAERGQRSKGSAHNNTWNLHTSLSGIDGRRGGGEREGEAVHRRQAAKIPTFPCAFTGGGQNFKGKRNLTGRLATSPDHWMDVGDLSHSKTGDVKRLQSEKREHSRHQRFRSEEKGARGKGQLAH